MSRIGKAPVYLNDKVKVSVDCEKVLVKGAKAEHVIVLNPVIKAEVKDNQVILTRVNDEPQSRAYHGLYRSLIQNAVIGLTTGWSKQLELNGVGYRASVSGRTLELSLGYSHPIKFPIPKGLEIKVDKQTKLTVSGSDRQRVGEVSAQIREFRPPEPYLGKGVKYVGEYIRRKAGKSAAKATK